MATDKDMTYGHDISDAVLDKVHASFPGGHIDDGDPASLVVAVLLLDELLGLSEPDDKLIIDPSLGVWLLMMVNIVSPARLVELSKKMAALEDNDETMEDDNPESAAIEEELGRLTNNWFEVCFNVIDPDTKEPYQYHPRLHDKTLTIRFLTEEEREDAGFFCATVRATDGTLVQLPRGGRRVFK